MSRLRTRLKFTTGCCQPGIVLVACVAGMLLAACQAPVAATTRAGPQESETAQATTSEPAAARTAAPTPTRTPRPTRTPAPSPTPTPEPLADASDFDPAELEAIAALNGWRLSQNLLPYAPNESLREIANAQADYLLTLPSLPNGVALHFNAQGQGTRDRALAGGWPHYATPDQTAAVEVACALETIQDCLSQWQGSPDHYHAISDPGYREIGVAVRPVLAGNLYLVLLGSRPDVLPALVDPLGEKLYLTSEQFRFSGGTGWIQRVTEVQILASPDDEPATDAWVPYEPSLPLPEDVAGTFAVAYTDGTHQVITEVRPAIDVVWTPELLAEIAP